MDDISNIKFNLTPLMAKKIVEINNLKIKLHDIEEKIKCVNSKDEINKLSIEKDKTVKEIDIQKKGFIKEFQENNQEQINKYLELKEKN